MLYEIQNGTVSLGGDVILDHIDFSIKGKEKIAVVGRNGCGKTTLLRLIDGQLSLDRDDRSFGPGIRIARDTTIGMLKQKTWEDKEITVAAYIATLQKDVDPFSENAFLFEQEFDRMFTSFGFTREDKQKQIAAFSGGEQTKIALIHLLLSQPDILLLDEPTNHLDIGALAWLENYIKNYPHAVVMVSHDRYFLDQCAEVVYEIQNGKALRYAGNYTAYKKQREKNDQIQKKRYMEQQQEIERLNELIERFKHKPKKASMARSKKKVLERMQRIDAPVSDHPHIFTKAIEPKHPGSKWAIEALDSKIGYDHVLKELSLRVKRGQKIGIIGENGSGKSTLLRSIAGELPLLAGSISLGNGVDMRYFHQDSAELVSECRVFEHYSNEFPDQPVKEVKKTLAQYLFRGDEAGKKVTDLSGGEKARLILAETIEARPNLLLLDEPTNHMDIPAKETLESAFSAYKGTILVVSHDRYFLKEIVDSLLVFDADKISYYPFGYDHYMEKLRKEKEYGGQAGASLVEVENTLLINSLHDVPEKRRMQAARYNTEQSYTDWQLSLMEEKLGKMRDRLAYLEEQADPYAIWEDAEYKARWESQWQLCMEEYTGLLLDWYDRWLDYEDAFADYQEE